MKKRLLSILLCLCMVLTLLPMAALAVDAPTFSGGTGTKSDPWQIGTKDDLVTLATFVNDGSAADFDTDTYENQNDKIGNFHGYYFQQTADIDMTGVTWEPIGYCGSYYFAGNYDGGNNTVSNITSTGKVDASGYATAGLFGWVAFGSVSNLTVKNANVTATSTQEYAYAGGVLAVAYNAAIEKCTVIDSEIHAIRTPAQSAAAGGLVGFASVGSSFVGCTSIGNAVSSVCFSGGFAGNSDNSAGSNSFATCVAENCIMQAGNDDASLGSHTGGFLGTVESGETSLTGCKVLNCTLKRLEPAAYEPSCGIFWAGHTSDGSCQLTNCSYYTEDASPANTGNAIALVKIDGEYYATATVTTDAELTAALKNSEIGYIYIAGNITCDTSIEREVNINVKSGSTLTLNYSTNTSTSTKVSTVCNANITVEDGGKLDLHAKGIVPTEYLVMNGRLTINAGGEVTATRGLTGAKLGGVLLQGKFTNNGSVDVAAANMFLKYGTTPGTFNNGSPCYNLCIKTPQKTSVNDAKLYITDVAGTVAVGEKLHPVLDGFGEITKLIPGLGISWGDSNNGGNTFEYTVPSSKAGSTITVKVNGSPSNDSYAYFLVNGTTVTEVTDFDSTGFTTAKVAQLDTVYVGGESASDSNTGASADKALATFATAYTLVADGGTIVVCGATTAGNYVMTDKNLTITNTDGTTTYTDAVLDVPCIYVGKTVTFNGVKLANGTSKQFNLYPSAATAVINLNSVTSDCVVFMYGTAATVNVNNTPSDTLLTVIPYDYTTDSYLSLNLNDATVISNNGNAMLGDVSLANGSTLLTTQTIKNLTSDSSDNALALFSKEGTPVSVTVNGTVTIADGKPITLLNYKDNAYQAFTAGNLTLLTSSAENASLTAEKFITKDTVNYSLKKDGNRIVTEKKIIVSFNANGGTCETATLTADENGKLASLPTPTKSGSYTFDGWYTLETGGTKITTGTIFTDSTTVYAHWNYTGGSSGGGSTPPTVTVPISSNEGKVSVSASVSGGTATVTATDKQLAEITSNTANTGTVTVDLSGLKNVDSAKIPAKIITAANTATGSDGLEIVLPTGTVKLDETALKSLASSNKDITVSVETVKTSTLTDAQKEALGDKLDSAVVVDINILMNGTKVTNFDGGTLTVSFPYTPKSGEDTSKLTVWYVKDDGTIEKMGGHYDAKSKCFVFETTHLSQYILVSDANANPFTDVADDAYYYDAVLWAVGKGVTAGTTATTFAPNETCTRGQTVTFLWRAMGSPEPTTTVNPFSDVSADAYYYKAVLWAAEKGITAGTSATTFSPEDTVSRSQVATFLWRTAGKPAASKENAFSDVSHDAYYFDAVLWAAEKGITSGTTATTFAPNEDCTRGQIVTFLYRYLGK